MSRDANEIRLREGLDALREEIDRAHQTAGSKQKNGHAEPNGKEDDEAEIERLAQLSSIQYDQERKAAAEKLGVRTSTLDVSVQAEREKTSKELKDFLPHWKVEAWSEAVAGTVLLDELRKHFARYIVLPKHSDVVLALWTPHGLLIGSISRPIWQSPRRRDGAARRCS